MSQNDHSLIFVSYLFQQCTVSPPVPPQPTIAQIQHSPVITLLQTPPQNTLAMEHGALSSKTLARAVEGGHTPLNEVFTHHSVQVNQNIFY